MASPEVTLHIMQTELTKIVKEEVARFGVAKISATAVVPVSDTSKGISGSKKKGNADLVVRVALLDSRLADFSIPSKALPQYLLERVCTFLHIDDQEYFGLSMPSGNTQITKWLKPKKSIKSQLKDFESVCLRVKFYPHKPSLLRSSMSRYFIILQTQQDILSGRLTITTQDLIVFAALLVQIHLGSFDPSLHLDDYVSTLDILPPKSRTADTERRIMERHRFTTSGMTMEEAEVAYLEHAQRLPLFGAFRLAAKDSNNVLIDLAISARGLSLLEDKNHKEVTRHKWNQILEMSYRRSTFCVTVRQVNPANTSGAYFTDHKCEYRCKTEKDAKLLWRFAIENHVFFRGRVPVEAETAQGYKQARSSPPTENFPKNHASTRQEVPTVTTRIVDKKDLEITSTPTITTAKLRFSSFSDPDKSEQQPVREDGNYAQPVQLRQKVDKQNIPDIIVTNSNTKQASHLSPEGPSEVSTTRSSLLLESSIEAEGEDVFVGAVDEPPPAVLQVYAALADIIDRKNASREAKRLATEKTLQEQNGFIKIV